MIHKKLLAGIVVIIVVAAALVVAWQLTNNTPSSENKTIKIGLIAPASGSSIGQDMDRAAKLAVKQINEAGGIYVDDWGTNATISLVTYDTIADAPADAKSAMDRAILTDGITSFAAAKQQQSQADANLQLNLAM